jgi:hypothetical protein
MKEDKYFHFWIAFRELGLQMVTLIIWLPSLMKEHIKYFHFLNAFRELGFKRCETFSSGTKFRYAERSPTAQFPTKKNLTPPSIELRKKKIFTQKPQIHFLSWLCYCFIAQQLMWKKSIFTHNNSCILALALTPNKLRFWVARFFLVKYTKSGKIYQIGKNIPNGHKMYQMAGKLTKRPWNISPYSIERN